MGAVQHGHAGFAVDHHGSYAGAIQGPPGEGGVDRAGPQPRAAIVAAAVLNLDPVLQVFGPLIGILGFAVLAMMAFASISAIVYFGRSRQPRPGILVRLIAPVLASLGLLWVLVMSLTDRKFNRMRPSMARVLGLETRSAKEG